MEMVKNTVDKKICLLKLTTDGVDGGLKVACNLLNELTSRYTCSFVGVMSEQEKPYFELDSSVKYDVLMRKKDKLTRIFFSACRLFRKYVIENDIDIVMSVGVSANAIMITSCLGLGVKTIVCDHMNSKANVFSKSIDIQRKYGAKLANKVVTLTKEDKLNYIAKFNLKENKVVDIHNWFEPYNVTDFPRNKKLVTVGRFDYQKGYDYLVQVASKVLNKKSDWTWEIYGSGSQDEVDKIKNLIKENDLQDKLFIKGLEKNQNLIYGDKGIYVMTSRYEGLPLVLLEAQQYNLPIVSFRCPTGPSEIVEDGVNGYLIDCYDTDKMSAKLLELMGDELLRQSFSEHAKDNMDKFDKNRILNQWTELIETI